MERFFLDIRGRTRQINSEAWQGSMTLELVRPLGLPFARVSGLATLRGRVVDSESPDQAGVPNVLLRLDQHRAVTDDEGRFAFPNIAEGDYRLDLSRPSLGVDRALTHQSPIRVSLSESEGKEILLTVARTGSVRGRVALFSSQGTWKDMGVQNSEAEHPGLILEGARLLDLESQRRLDQAGAGAPEPVPCITLRQHLNVLLATHVIEYLRPDGQ